MKLKSLKGVVHSLCQMAVGWENTELIQLVPRKNGRVHIDVLSAQSFLEGEPLPGWGIGSALRDWLFTEIERLGVPRSALAQAHVEILFDFSREAHEPSLVVARYRCTSELEASGRPFVGSFEKGEVLSLGRP